MLDVHPPHHAANSWRDFFIHIATIVVGLLIAIALEQTVEAIHHRHQRNELIEQLDAEHHQTLKDAIDDAANDEMFLNWEAERIEALQRVITQHQPYSAPPRPAAAVYNSPGDPVWLAAKASGLTSLLPQQVVIANSEPEILLRHMGDQIAESVRVQNTILIPACSRVPLLPDATEPDYAHADIHDLRDCLAANMSAYAARRAAFILKIYIRGAEEAILDGETDIDRIDRREIEEGNAARTRLRPVTLPR